MGKILKFGTVGIFNTLITIVSYTLLYELGVQYLVANIIAYFLGVLNSYYWNKNWVFQSTSKHRKLFSKFIVVNLITLMFNTGSLYIFVDYLRFHPVIGQIISIGIGMVINFILNKKWTFSS